jgi:hypothetical protein
MIKPEQIPDEVVKAAKAGYFRAAEVNRNAGDVITDVWLAALAAALNAWPNMWVSDWEGFSNKILLPLPKEGA